MHEDDALQPILGIVLSMERIKEWFLEITYL